jgi:hypothetical protein
LRKLFIGALVGALVLAFAAVAFGVSEQTFTMSFSKKTKKTSTGINFQVHSEDNENTANNNLPKSTRRLRIKMPAKTRIQPAAAPQCKATDQEFTDEGKAACPKGSQVGTGKAIARFKSASLQNVNVVVTAFNAPKGLILYLEPDISVPFILRPKWTGNLDNGPTLDTRVPANCVASSEAPDGKCRDNAGNEGFEAVLTDFQLSTVARNKGKGKKRKNLIRTPTKCGTAQWTFTANWTYSDGTTERRQSKSACK